MASSIRCAFLCKCLFLNQYFTLFAYFLSDFKFPQLKYSDETIFIQQKSSSMAAFIIRSRYSAVRYFSNVCQTAVDRATTWFKSFHPFSSFHTGGLTDQALCNTTPTICRVYHNIFKGFAFTLACTPNRTNQFCIKFCSIN